MKLLPKSFFCLKVLFLKCNSKQAFNTYLVRYLFIYNLIINTLKKFVRRKKICLVKKKWKIIVYLAKLTVYFNSNIKVSIFAIHLHKVAFFFSIRPILSQNSHIAPIFFFINKKTNFGVQKWPHGQRSDYNHPDFFKI